MPGKTYHKAQQLIKTAIAQGKTIATAESCTGGGVGKALTAIPGSSSVYAGGLITYANTVKTSLLGIPPDIISFYGAVSEPTARAMAQQMREMLDVHMAVSVTGIAGPGGGSADKPVGTVWFGLSTPQETHTYKKEFGDIGRGKVRKESVRFALDLLQACLAE